MERITVVFTHMPVIFAAVLTSAIFLSYAIALSNGQVYPFLPSISRTAAFEPGGSVFSLLLFIVVPLTLGLISLRYLQLRRVAVVGNSRETHRRTLEDYNGASFLFGLVMILGIAVIASFRCPLTKEEDYTLGTIHYIGSGLIYLGGAFYCCFQTIVTFYISPRFTFVTRLSVTLVYCVTGATFPFLKALAYFMFEGSGDPANIATWHPGQGGYTVHVLACAGEWVAVLSLAGFALTFRQEIRDLRLDVRCSLAGHQAIGNDKRCSCLEQDDSDSQTDE